MNNERKRGGRKRDLDDVVAAAIQDGLSEDKAGIDNKPVRPELLPNSELQYEDMMNEWKAYERKFPGSDPRNMIDMKHFVEFVGRSTVGRIEKFTKKATTWSVRNKMRKFMSQWQRKTGLTIPHEVHDSVTPEIEGPLKRKIGLSTAKRAPKYLTIENYVHMEEQLWLRDYHNYIHEGSRVDCSALLKMHCYTSSRLQEVCMSKYKDLLCMVAWKDGELEFKIGLKRFFAKGMQNNPKKPQHPLYERLTPTPPLFANGVLFLLAIFLSVGAFRDYGTIGEVFAARPPSGHRFRMLEWAEHVLDDPVFPEMSAAGLTKKTRNKTAWGNQCSDWAKRAGFPEGVGLHAARREVLIKADDGGYSLGQVMKFAAHRNPKTLVGHYLDDMSTIDGAAAFLGLEQRRDLTEDFRSASMGRDPNLRHSLPAKTLDELKHRQDFASLEEQIEMLSSQIGAAITRDAREELKAQRRRLYKERQKLVGEELRKDRKGQRRAHVTYSEVQDQGDWRRSYFTRVVCPMQPERKRLARLLPLSVPLRSAEGISALENLIALRKNDSRVAYQDVLQPVEGRCVACAQEIKSIAIKDRWSHVYRCYKNSLKSQHGFVEFCFRCAKAITSEADWETHCKDHIDNLDVSFRCYPVTFRHALACTGYCASCLGNKELPAAKRMRQFDDRAGWQRHISACMSQYIKKQDAKRPIPCPHLICTAELASEQDLWHHLEDFHSITKASSGTKRRYCSKEDDGRSLEPGHAAKTKRPRLRTKTEDRTVDALTSQRQLLSSCSEDAATHKFVSMSVTDFNPMSMIDTSTVSSSGPTPYYMRQDDDSVRGEHGGCSDSDALPPSLPGELNEANLNTANGDYTPRLTPSDTAAFDMSADIEPWGFDKDAASSFEFPREAWNSSRPDSPPSSLSGLSIDMIDPELYSDFPRSKSDLPTSTGSFDGPDGNTSTIVQRDVDGIAAELLSSDRKVVEQPAPIDAENDVWEAEKLLAKWTKGRATWYLVKWKGFDDSFNKWEKRKNIGIGLISEFDASGKGNDLGVERLLDKRTRRRKAEFLVKWKGLPESENSWEKAVSISRERIVAFEAEQG